MRKCASSAELLAAVDFGDAMSNPLHKNIDSLWAALDSQDLRNWHKVKRISSTILH
jgi:hypothetical protein